MKTEFWKWLSKFLIAYNSCENIKDFIDEWFSFSKGYNNKTLIAFRWSGRQFSLGVHKFNLEYSKENLKFLKELCDLEFAWFITSFKKDLILEWVDI